MREWRGRWALVTGASSGLGIEFSDLLAGAGCNIAMIARRRERLDRLDRRLRERYGVKTMTVPRDLLESRAVERTVEELAGTQIDILINSAGFGIHGPFIEADWRHNEDMLRLDLLVLSELTHRYGRLMAQRRKGWILNVASIGAFQPAPSYAAYAAAKSYVLSFSYALRRELAPYDVVVSTVSPGITRSEFLNVAGQHPSFYQRVTMRDSRWVARAGIRALARRRPGVVPGLPNKIGATCMRLLPRTWQAAVADWLMRY